MFYRCIAALFILPASFLVFKTPGAWFLASRQGFRSLFSIVMRSSPELQKQTTSRAGKLFVWYPLQVGMHIMHEQSFSKLAKSIFYKIKRKIVHTPQASPWELDPSLEPPQALPSLERLRDMIRNPAIQVISFDIFDTLLVRPSLRPTDIFHLLARKVDAAHGVDFISMRMNVEERLGKLNATIHDIYAFIQKEHNLSAELAATLMAEEVRCEEALLTPRRIIAELHAEAVRLGKRVIAVSDMYLPSDVLRNILHCKGMDVEAVYVSCEHGVRKSDGGLYDVVIAAENVHPSAILHIGDNVESDYVRAIEKNITAMYYPSVVDIAFSNGTENNSAYAAAFGKDACNDPLWSLLLGFGLNQLYDSPEPPADIMRVQDLRHFSLLTMAPLLTGFCLHMANSQDIQKNYTRIYFASRDGFLPHKVYEAVARKVPCLPGVYFYAGRRAYYPWLYDSFWEYATEHANAANRDAYTLHNFITAYFQDHGVLDLLETELSTQEKDLPFFRNKAQCISILRRFQDPIDACMYDKRAAIKAYYDTIFDDAPRHLIFDIGYSGSIGKALTRITGKPADKVYFWECPENRSLDETTGTTTRVFMHRNGYPWANVLCEELFSPCEGGTIGFEGLRPVQEEIVFSPAHEQDLACVQKTCLDYAENFCRTLGDYAPFMTLREPDAALELCNALLESASATNLTLFRNITFPDPVFQTVSLSLEKKIEHFFHQHTVFSGTGFENADTVFHLQPCLQTKNERIGIHMHLYHADLSREIQGYLQDFPVPFDLYITIPDAAFTRTAQNLFSRAMLPQVGDVTVLPTPNRGRDVAPWVLYMRPYQDRYDLFCHVHTKKSANIGFGNTWRRYLWNNLLRADSVTDMLNAFAAQPKLGCLFPEIYHGVRLVMTDVAVPLYGSEHEYELITNRLRVMGFAEELRRSELFFPVGTMLWYRPHALRQLFTCDLSLEDFAAEPVGVGGTLAHAMERLPAVVAQRNGYLAKNHTRYVSR